MGVSHLSRIAAGWRRQAVVAIVILVAAAAPAAVRGKQMQLTKMYRAAAVDEMRTLVPAELEAAGAAAPRGLPARVTTISGTAPPEGSELSQEQDSTTSSVASIPLGGCSRTNYLIPIELSYDGAINVVLDSGSAELAVASTACDSSCSKIPGAFPFHSPGDTDYTDQLNYGSANLFGYVFAEGIQLKGLKAVGINMLAITSQKGLLKKVSCVAGDAAKYTYVGILGFGPDETATLNEDGSIMGILAAAGVPKIFAPALCTEGGHVYIGGYDSSVIESAPLYTPLYAAGDYTGPDGQSLYQGYLVTVAGISMGGHSLGLDAENSIWLVDTGTNFLDLPPTVAANAANRLNGPFQRLTGIRGFFDRGDQCTFPKRTTPAQLDAALPTLDFTFPSVRKGYTLTASFSASTFLTTVTHSNGTYQYCSISASNAADNGGVNVMPNNLMNGLMVIFDQEKSQLGFAKLKSSACPAPARKPTPRPTPKRKAAPTKRHPKPHPKPRVHPKPHHQLHRKPHHRGRKLTAHP